MTSSSQPHSTKALPSWLFAILAVVAATGMWYMVSVKGRIEVQLEVNIDYYGIPPNLVVTDGLINKIIVRLRGAETLLRSIPRERLNWGIDLSSITKGTSIVPLPNEEITPALRGFEVVDIVPPRIVVQADTLIEKRVPVRHIVNSPLASGAVTIENISFTPTTVLLRGPESIIAPIPDVPLRIPLDPKEAGRTIEQTLPLDTPGLVTATPSSVRTKYTITSGRAKLVRTCFLSIAGDTNHIYTVTPQEIKVRVEVPESLANSSAYLRGLEARVTPPPLEPGESKKVRVHFRLPDGMTILDNPQEEVMVSRQKKS